MNPDKMQPVPTEQGDPAVVDPKSDAEPSTEVETVDIEWHGVVVSMPASVEDWDLDAVDAFEQGRMASAIRYALGDDAYSSVVAKFKAKNGRKPTVRDLEPLMDEFARIYGFETSGN